MASIAEMIETTSARLDELANTTDPRKEAGHTLFALAELLWMVRQQEDRTQRIAQALDELAGKISFLSTSPTEVREQVQLIARLIRDEQQE